MNKRLRKDKLGVSPIVATLMLVLVTIGAAVGFYVWFSGWQKSITDDTGGVETQASMKIGGSTTVYEFSVVGVEMFEAKDPSYKIDVQKGGSGAGIKAVGEGSIDLGSSSKPIPAADLVTYPDLQQHLIAYDFVVPIVKSGHSLVSMNETVMKAIWDCNGLKSGFAAPAWLSPGGDNLYQWNEIPAQSTAMTPPCTETSTIVLLDRNDESGTEGTFLEKVIDCGSYTSLEAYGITATHMTSNQEMMASVAGDGKYLSVGAWGLAKQSVNGCKIPGFTGDSVTVTGAQMLDNTYVSSNVKSGAFANIGGRGIYYITNGEPQGAVKMYLDFVMGPAVNQEICLESGYISIY
jgi:phosphate transport system substrate-binding protein